MRCPSAVSNPNITLHNHPHHHCPTAGATLQLHLTMLTFMAGSPPCLLGRFTESQLAVVGACAGRAWRPLRRRKTTVCQIIPPPFPFPHSQSLLRNCHSFSDIEHLFLLGACTTGAREKKRPVKGLFDPVVACDQLVGGETAVRAALTKAQLTAIVEAFVTRERDLTDRVAELAAERDEAVEKLSRRRGLESAFREQQLVKRMAEIASRRGASPTFPPAVVLSEHTSPPAALPSELRDLPADVAAVQADAAITTTSTPAAAAATTTTSPAAAAVAPVAPAPATTPAPIPSWRRLAASIGGYLSPFAGRSSPQPIPQTEPPAARTDEPLRELTGAARKRAAPEDEPRRIRTPSAFVGPSSRNPQVPTSLSAITERTERSTSVPGSLNTPSRAPRSVRAVRAARQNSGTPAGRRTWQAHARQSTSSASMRYHRMRQLDLEVEERQHDQERNAHRSKRVKVSDLVTLPHHRPGESSSTFRVPDIDSDGEMEVDEDVPVRSKPFAIGEAQPSTISSSETLLTQGQTLLSSETLLTQGRNPSSSETLLTQGQEIPSSSETLLTQGRNPSSSETLLTQGRNLPFSSETLLTQGRNLPSSSETLLTQGQDGFSSLEAFRTQGDDHPSSSETLLTQGTPFSSSSEALLTQGEGESFTEWYNKPTGRPLDPAAAFWYDRFSLVFDQAGIPRRDPNFKFTDEDEAAECGRRFKAGQMFTSS
nr:hypothetical protein CFP56_42244 [Quercus suber]